ncbi:hypothetical protein CEXT_301021 [Caerostris extrusa]|uniref:Uncharacterized protein n=1 Tax=Caerostris extrusa TaxID=172846 RepID=A0AAV4XCH0_CAEEX|nr:hypothetical protein CEXT_301021 [Caerostris extrusa]
MDGRFEQVSVCAFSADPLLQVRRLHGERSVSVIRASYSRVPKVTCIPEVPSYGTLGENPIADGKDAHFWKELFNFCRIKVNFVILWHQS